MTDVSTVRVGIAVVEQDGKYLVGIRPEGKPLAGFAEFPGGKCDPGELFEDCVRRECLEETGLHVRPERLLETRSHVYAHGHVELAFWLCHLVSHDTIAAANGFRWVRKSELRTLKFPEANAGVIALLANG